MAKFYISFNAKQTIPEVKYLRKLTSCRIGAIKAQGAGGKGEGGSIRTSDYIESSITIAGPSAVVAQAQCVLCTCFEGHSSFKAQFGDLIDAVVRSITSVGNFHGIPSLVLPATEKIPHELL